MLISIRCWLLVSDLTSKKYSYRKNVHKLTEVNYEEINRPNQSHTSSFYKLYISFHMKPKKQSATVDEFQLRSLVTMMLLKTNLFLFLSRHAVLKTENRKCYTEDSVLQVTWLKKRGYIFRKFHLHCWQVYTTTSLAKTVVHSKGIPRGVDCCVFGHCSLFFR